jgi:hypothetical protein
MHTQGPIIADTVVEKVGVRTHSVLIQSVTGGTAFESAIFVRPDAKTSIVRVMVSSANSVTAANSNFWQFDVLRAQSGTQSSMIAASSKFRTSTNTLVPFSAHSLGVDQNTGGSTNDVITLKGTNVGTPTSLSHLLVQVDYRKTL